MSVSALLDWKFDDHFNKISTSLEDVDTHASIVLGRQVLEMSAIHGHPFFQLARRHRTALLIWAAQECVITNHFSQVLFGLMSLIKNVHVRSLITPVVTGEHSAVKQGKAFGSHPHLLSKLIEDIGLQGELVTPLAPTIEFADFLSSSTRNLFYGLGALGIGNESMLIPEYLQIENAFSKHFPRRIYRPFLRANIEEDKEHSGLMEYAAVALFEKLKDEKDYLSGASDGVNARVKYYDQMHKLVIETER